MIENAEFLLIVLMGIPLLGIFFAAISKESPESAGRNVLSVGILTVVSNLVILVLIGNNLIHGSDSLRIMQKFEWLSTPKIEFLFAVDTFSLPLIAAVHIAILLGFFGVFNNSYRQKTLVILALVFLEMMIGYLLAGDLFSFYIFFEAMLLPLFLLVGILGDVHRQDILYRFFLYNLLGASFLFMALCILFNHQHVTIQTINTVVLSHNLEIIVWGAIFVAFLSRIPIWPFHYWISSVNVNISNPLVFIIANILPLTGVYGLIRFFPLTAPGIIAPYLLALEIISIITMVVIALIGFSHRDVQYKIFSYMTVYYILYLLGALLPTDALLSNIGFSIFSWLIIVAAVEVIISHIEKERQQLGLPEYGILKDAKTISFVLSFFVLAAVGLPLSSMFLNNMFIFAGLLTYNLKMAMFILFAIILSSVNLLQHLFYLKYSDNEVTEKNIVAIDLPSPIIIVLGATILLIITSFINPLWYME